MNNQVAFFTLTARPKAEEKGVEKYKSSSVSLVLSPLKYSPRAHEGRADHCPFEMGKEQKSYMRGWQCKTTTNCIQEKEKKREKRIVL